MINQKGTVQKTVSFLYSKTKRMRGGEAWQEHQIGGWSRPWNYMQKA
nr:MAG TPA: hypothetical protein [Caudoviricetes sp.]